MSVPTGEDPIFRYGYGMDNWHEYCMKISRTDRSQHKSTFLDYGRCTRGAQVMIVIAPNSSGTAKSCWTTSIQNAATS